MQKHYNYLNIDLDKKIYNKLKAVQGDSKSRYVLVNLINNSTYYDLSDCTVKIYGVKKDKTIFFNDATIIDAIKGQFEIELTNQALAVAGDLKLQILILGPNQEKLSTFSFFIEVAESIIDDAAIESTNEFTALITSLNKLEEWNGYFEETSGKIEEKYTERLNNLDEQFNTITQNFDSRLNNIAKISSANLQNDINNNSTIYIDKDLVINEEIVIPSNKTIKFRNGAKVISTIEGTKNVFKIVGDNVKIYYPNIEYTVTSSSPHGGLGNAIAIGNYSSVTEETYHNIKIYSPTIKRNDNSGSIIAILNSCHNIKIDNPTIIGGALGIMLHWSGDFNESEPHTSASSISWHPHGIKINNYKYIGVGKATHLASCYDVEVDGIEATNASTIVEVGCGDYANTIATSRQKYLVGKQLKIKNIYGYNIQNNAISVSAKGTRGGDTSHTNILPKYELSIENVLCEKGDNTSNGAVIIVCNDESKGVSLKNINSIGYLYSSQIFLQDCSNVNIDACNFDENNHNITLVNVKHIDINDCVLSASANPINFSNASANTLCENVNINKCVFNKGYYNIYIHNAKDLLIDKCIFNDYKSNTIKFGGSNKNLTLRSSTFNKGTTTGVSSNVEVGLVEVFKCYDNVFNAMDTNIKFNINILASAYKCNIYNNTSYGTTTSGAMMIYQGTRSDRSNTIFNNTTLNGFNVGTFTNYYSIDFIDK